MTSWDENALKLQVVMAVSGKSMYESSRLNIYLYTSPNIQCCNYLTVCLFICGCVHCILSSTQEEVNERRMGGILLYKCERRGEEDREASVNRVVYL